ncbi:MAG TPA: NAD(P)-dependent glycerol-3-phosphate dehydrogenase [Persephonella sp.]|nr:NAD(P)-dependent glycerol-3-phosphate dehydrogenase [Hydrogenothermaceae bacterium]HIQ25223.1 NAD(P)-dependent glycerol-3-phosphate dehydrogenase [Persephonella sp.]
MNLTILGTGSWGTALAQTFSVNFENVLLWGINKEVVDTINTQNKNTKYFPEIILNKNIKATLSLEEAISFSKIIVIAIPTQAIRETLRKIGISFLKNKIFISASKGIEISSLKLISQIIKEETYLPEENIFVLSGPSFAKEVALGLPTAVTLAGDLKKAEELQMFLNTENFRTYITDDIKGVEVGGAVKNVIAIATGISDGLCLGNNARAGLITRGLYEMTKVATFFGGRKETLYGLSGMGDLVLTATGDLSRNRKFGNLIGQGISINQALKKVGQVVEGYKTVKALKKLVLEKNIELPITDAVYSVLYENLSPKEAVKILMSRQPKKEFD